LYGNFRDKLVTNNKNLEGKIMKTSVYITFDQVSHTTGAGQVCHHEIKALSEVTEIKQIITKKEIGEKIDGHYPFSPFLYDYFCAQLIEHRNVDLAHLSCSPANAILNKLQPKHYVVNCPAHNLEESVREHETITGTPYPFIHNTDPYLRSTLWKHLKEADSVITPSNRSADWIENNIYPKRVTTIPHGVNLPEKIDYPKKFTNVGYIGAWGPDKGVKYLVEAWSRLNYDDSTLMFFGGNSEQMKSILEKWATGGRYHLYGNFNSLDEVMPHISVYVQPSVSEGYGMTLPEAMAYGKVVIGSEGAGSTMLIENGKNGLSFPPRDVDALVTCLDDLKRNFSDFRYMGENARVTAEQYTWGKIKQRYVDFYRGLLK